jgi:hypothetical protein
MLRGTRRVFVLRQVPIFASLFCSARLLPYMYHNVNLYYKLLPAFFMDSRSPISYVSEALLCELRSSRTRKHSTRFIRHVKGIDHFFRRQLVEHRRASRTSQLFVHRTHMLLQSRNTSSFALRKYMCNTRACILFSYIKWSTYSVLVV